MKRFYLKFIAIVSGVTFLCTTAGILSPLSVSAEGGSSIVVHQNTQSPVFKLSRIQEGSVYIPANTQINLELLRTLDSKTAKTGDPIRFKTIDNLIINNVVVIPAGSTAKGTVTKAGSAGGLGRSGKLEIAINSVQTLNGIEVPLAYSTAKSGQSDGGAVAVFAVVSIIGGLFMKGTNVQIAEGTKFEAIVTEDTDLKVQFADLANAMSSSKPHGVVIQLPVK